MTIEADEKPTFSQEDLAEIEADDGDETESAPTGGAGDKGKAGAEGAGNDGKSTKTIAGGDDTEAEAKAKEDAEAKAAAPKAAEKAEQVKQLRDALAKHYAAGDKKRYNAELKRLERLGIERPEQVYGLYRELDNRLNGGGLIKVPGKDAKPEDIADFHKAIGVPEKPEDYLKDVKLDNGAVIGDADKPVIGAFAEAMHKAGAPPPVMTAALNWYYQHQEDIAAQQDEADEEYRRESERALKEELGPAFKRQTNAIASLFATAPGGADPKNENSLYARLVGGRTADGKLIGNDPEVMRWLIGLVGEVNPIASVVEDGGTSVKSIEKELEDLKTLRKTDRQKYWSPAVQAREAELYAAMEKVGRREQRG
jgi:hypothetical protein